MDIKAAAHVHSDWSYDGTWPLPRIANFFGKIGFRLVLMSEHDATFDSKRWQQYQEACRSFSTHKTLLVPGIEYSDPDNTIHVLVWGVTAFLGKQQATTTILQKAHEQEGFCVLAHPSRRQAWREIDASWPPLLNGVEMWNRKADGFAPSQEALNILQKYPNLKPFVGLDYHRYNQLFPLSIRMNIDPPLSVESVFRALHSRIFTVTAMGISTKHYEKFFLRSCVNAVERLRGKTARTLKRLRQ